MSCSKFESDGIHRAALVRPRVVLWLISGLGFVRGKRGSPGPDEGTTALVKLTGVPCNFLLNYPDRDSG